MDTLGFYLHLHFLLVVYHVLIELLRRSDLRVSGTFVDFGAEGTLFGIKDSLLEDFLLLAESLRAFIIRTILLEGV